MKRKTIILIIIFVGLLIISIMVVLIGFGGYAAASIPFQDSQLAPASALEKQARDMQTGENVILTGLLLFLGTILYGMVIGLWAIIGRIANKGKEHQKDIEENKSND